MELFSRRLPHVVTRADLVAILGPTDAAARALFAGIDRCGAGTVSVAPSPCVAYQGCASGAPVVWCEFTGAHEVQDWEPPALMAFFDGL